MSDEQKRVVIAGAGAAGLQAAVFAARTGAQTLLLEKTARVGYKILISGHGRCNITNAEPNSRELAQNYPGGSKFLLSAFSQFDTQDMIRFIEELGVPTKQDSRGRVYPASDQSEEVVDAYLRELERLGVELRTETPVRSIRVENGAATGVILESADLVPAGAVIVTVGGESFPRTGSTGDGYRMAGELGHTVEPPFPALVPLKVAGVKELAGLALKDVEAAVVVDGKRLLSRRGDMLFAHFGLTGPIILHMSRHAVFAMQREGKAAAIHVDLVPDLTAEDLQQRLRQDWERRPKQQLPTTLKSWMPERLVPHCLAAAGVDGSTQAGSVTKGDRHKLVQTMKRWVFPVIGPLSKEVAEVTAGGLRLSELQPKTMESKLVRNLFWAGEVLDVDGYIGGYNFQSAWSTGYVAGIHAARRVLGDD